MSKILIMELKEFDATALSGTYQNFGAALSNPGVKVQFFNTSDVDAYITIDGTNAAFRIPANGALTFDENTVWARRDQGEYYMDKGTRLKVKQVTGAGASGNIIAHIVTRDLS